MQRQQAHVNKAETCAAAAADDEATGRTKAKGATTRHSGGGGGMRIRKVWVFLGTLGILALVANYSFQLFILVRNPSTSSVDELEVSIPALVTTTSGPAISSSSTTSTSPSPTSGPIPKNRTEIYEKRRERIRSFCSAHNILPLNGPHKVDNGRYPDADDGDRYQRQWRDYVLSQRPQNTVIYDPRHDLTYCWVRKVASTSWQRVFFAMKGMDVDPRKAFQGGKKLAPAKEKVNRALYSEDTLRFFFVRDPFDRLVSAYVQKFELGYRTDWAYKTYVPKILNFNGVPFDKKAREESLPRPTFSQFINFVLGHKKVNSLDDHWRPQWLHCHVCEVDYQVPGYLETAVEDSEFVVEARNLTLPDGSPVDLPWNNKSFRTVHGSNRTHPDTAGYMAELDPSQVVGLFELYRPDFELFGYSAAAYLPKDAPPSSEEND